MGLCLRTKLSAKSTAKKQRTQLSPIQNRPLVLDIVVEKKVLLFNIDASVFDAREGFTDDPLMLMQLFTLLYHI